MKNTIIRGIVLIAVFLSAWYILSLIDWLSILRIDDYPFTKVPYEI